MTGSASSRAGGSCSSCSRYAAGGGADLNELLAEIRTTNRERTVDRRAGKLAQLAAAGQLRLADPNLATRQLTTLVSDDLVARSGLGAVQLSPPEIAAPVDAGVDTFLAAFGPR